MGIINKMLLSTKAQMALEYMAVVGFTTITIIILIAISFTYSKDVDDQIVLNQAERIVKNIVNNAESVYYFGEPSKVKLTVYFPQKIENIIITNNEINFVVRTKNGLTDVFKESAVNISGNLPTSYGYHDVIIEAKGNYVWINST